MYSNRHARNTFTSDMSQVVRIQRCLPYSTKEKEIVRGKKDGHWARGGKVVESKVQSRSTLQHLVIQKIYANLSKNLFENNKASKIKEYDKERI